MEPLPGMATRLALRVPGSAGTAGCEPSMDTVSWELVREMTSGDFLFLCRAFWMEAASAGRLANWWNTLRLRMMAYTRLQFPGSRGAGVCRCVHVWQRSNGKSSGSDFSLVCFLTIELVLDYVVESLQEEEDQVMVLRRREQEPAGGEGLQQVEQFVGSHHGEALQVGRHYHREEKPKNYRLTGLVRVTVKIC